MLPPPPLSLLTPPSHLIPLHLHCKCHSEKHSALRRIALISIQWVELRLSHKCTQARI